MTTPTATACRTCQAILWTADACPCIRCGWTLCLTCAAGAGCAHGGDHAPPGWAIRLSSGVWSASSSTWKGRRMHERAGAARLHRLVLSPKPGDAHLELWVGVRNRGALPPDLTPGQELELLLNGHPLVRGLVVGHRDQDGGVLLYVPASAQGWGIGKAGGAWWAPEAPPAAGAPA